MKKIAVLLLLVVSLFAFSGCQQKEPSLADQLKESQQKLEEARQREKEAKEKERQLEMLVNTLKNP